MRSRFFSLLLVLGVMAVTSACGADSGTSTRAINTDSDLHRVFALMPDSEQVHRHLRIVDLRAFIDLAGVPPPGPDATARDIANWKLELFLATRDGSASALGMFIFSPGGEWLSGTNWQYMEGVPDTRSSLGFDTRDLELVALAGESERSPKPTIELMLGEISSATAALSLEACSECIPHDLEEHAGVDYYAWGNDFAQSLRHRMALPAHDFLGRGGRIRIGDGHAYRTLRTADIEAVIDAETGKSPSLLDNDDWRLAADALSSESLLFVAATTANVDQVDLPKLTGAAFAPRENLQPDVREWMDNYTDIAATVTASASELPYHRLAVTGLTDNGGEIQAVMAVVFDDADTADRAATALRERAESGLREGGADDGLLPWSEAVQEYEFTSRGRVVIGRVSTTQGEQVRFVVRGDSTGYAGATEQELGPTAEFLLH